MNRKFKLLVCGSVPAIFVAGAGAGFAAGDEVQSVVSQAMADFSVANEAMAAPEVEEHALPPIPMRVYDVIDGLRG